MPPGAGVALSGLGGFGAASLYAWLVPGFFVGLPGLLILLVVLGQAVAGGLVVPLIRRALGENDSNQRRRRAGARVARS